jgi:hypothetical protein
MAAIPDHVLSARLDALEEQLKQVEPPNPPSGWIEQLGLNPADVPAEEDQVWIDVADGIREHVLVLEDQVNELRARLANADSEDALAQAWHDYRRVYENSQDLFRESLEFLGGLVFRQKAVPRAIYGVADALVRDMAKTGKKHSLTVPSSHDAVKRTFGRIIRLRYPEWTMWTLPLTAHAYGYVMVEEPPAAGAPRVAVLADGAAQLIAVEEGAGNDRVSSFLREYYTDAFATFTMGPAYACAAMLLRFNPACEQRDAASDLIRGEVILEMLRHMGGAPGLMNQYTGVIEQLKLRWSLILQRTRPAAALNDEERQQLSANVEQFYRLLDRRFLYSRYSGADLSRAFQWAGEWNRQLEESKLKLRLPDIPIESSLRDVLNAAWLSRLDHPDDVERISDIAHELCGNMLDRASGRKRQPTRQSSRSAGGSKPRIDGGGR